MRLPKFVTSLIESVRGKPSDPPAPFGQRKAKAEPGAAERALVLSGRAPENLSVRSLDLSGVTEPFRLPPRLQCFELNLARSSVESLPPGIQVAHRLDLTGCARLTNLPDGLKTGTLVLEDCMALTTLPENLAAHFLVLNNCKALQLWPETARVTLGRVSARLCTGLSTLPTTLGPIASLDLHGCTAIKSLPESIRVTSWLDLEGTGVAQLPATLRGVRLRWREALVTEEVYFGREKG